MGSSKRGASTGCPKDTAVTGMVAEVVAELFDGIALRRAHHQGCWLNRVAIEHLYGGVTSFERNLSASLFRACSMDQC